MEFNILFERIILIFLKKTSYFPIVSNKFYQSFWPILAIINHHSGSKIIWIFSGLFHTKKVRSSNPRTKNPNFLFVSLRSAGDFSFYDKSCELKRSKSIFCVKRKQRFFVWSKFYTENHNLRHRLEIVRFFWWADNHNLHAIESFSLFTPRSIALAGAFVVVFFQGCLFIFRQLVKRM